MRRHDTPADAKQQLAADVLAAVKGDVARYAASHTTSRVLQAAVKAAPAATRAAVLAELGDDVLTLAKSSYGHFLVRKLVATAPKEDVPGEFKKKSVRNPLSLQPKRR
jgi:pumilio homology domain family member 6